MTIITNKGAELTPPHERLQNDLDKGKQIETQLSRKITELTACNEQLQQGASETADSERYLRQQLAESQAKNEQLKSTVTENKHIEEALKLTARLGDTDATWRNTRKEFRANPKIN